MDTYTIEVEGMSCGGCVLSVEQAVRSVPEVRGVNVSLGERTATVDAPTETRARVIAAIEAAGFDARPRSG
jgi:copper chaperone CopZ